MKLNPLPPFFVPALLAWSLFSALSAQTPVTSSNTDSKFQQMEAIYQQQLSSRHIPILGDYLTELKKQVALASDPAAYNAEIERIQGIITAGGIVDLTDTVRALHPETATQYRPAAPESGKLKRAVTTLTPGFAQSILPVPEGSASPIAAEIGQMIWRLDHLPAGAYNFVLQYASLDAGQKVSLSLELGDQKVTNELTAKHATKDAKTFRLMRLGQLTLAENKSGATLTLTANTTLKPSLIVKSLVISPVKHSP